MCRAGREGPQGLIYFLVDSSAVWRLRRQPEPTEAWRLAAQRARRSCEPGEPRILPISAECRTVRQMSQCLVTSTPMLPVPKSWRWIDSAQHRLARKGGGCPVDCRSVIATLRRQG